MNADAAYDAVCGELAEVRAALERDCNATAIAGITPGKGHPLVDHVSRLQARLRLDHQEGCGAVVVKLREALAESDRLRAALIETRAALIEALDAWESVRDDSDPNWPTNQETRPKIDRLRAVARR